MGVCVRDSLCACPQGGTANLRPDESLKAGLKVVNAAVVELGHLVQQLLVLGLKVFPDRPELLFGLRGAGRTEETNKKKRTDPQLPLLTPA